MITDSQQHALMVLSSLGIALVLALAITLLFLRRRNWLHELGLLLLPFVLNPQLRLFCPAPAAFRIRDADRDHRFDHLR